MKILALDMSTEQASLALWDGQSEPLETTWREQRQGTPLLFGAVTQLMQQGGVTWEELDVLAAGRGPGMYSGLRTGIIVMQALALPKSCRLFFINSGVSVAAQALARTAAPEIAVVGDARRGMLWYGLFTRGMDGSAPAGGWRLAAWEDFDQQVPRTVPRVSSAWASLSVHESFKQLDAGAWMPEAVYPRAGVLAEQAAALIERGVESEPATPIYMHPPVG